jgi:hypothetical protein
MDRIDYIVRFVLFPGSWAMQSRVKKLGWQRYIIAQSEPTVYGIISVGYYMGACPERRWQPVLTTQRPIIVKYVTGHLVVYYSNLWNGFRTRKGYDRITQKIDEYYSLYQTVERDYQTIKIYLPKAKYNPPELCSASSFGEFLGNKEVRV